MSQDAEPMDRWMSAAQDLPLGQLRLPATHHGAVRRVSRGTRRRGGAKRFRHPGIRRRMGVYQSLTIDEQLAAGVRAFDVRVMTRDDGEIVVVHTFQTDVLLRDVVGDMGRFAAEHPTEKVLLFLRTEDSKNGAVSGDGLKALLSDDGRIDASRVFDGDSPCPGPLASCKVRDLKPVTVVWGIHMEGDCPQQHLRTDLRIVPCHVVPTAFHVAGGLASTAAVFPRSRRWWPCLSRYWSCPLARVDCRQGILTAVASWPPRSGDVRAAAEPPGAERRGSISENRPPPRRSDGSHGVFMCDYIDAAVISRILRVEWHVRRAVRLAVRLAVRRAVRRAVGPEGRHAVMACEPARGRTTGEGHRQRREIQRAHDVADDGRGRTEDGGRLGVDPRGRRRRRRAAKAPYAPLRRLPEAVVPGAAAGRHVLMEIAKGKP